MSYDLKTIATYWDPVEARLAKNRLEADGVTALLLGEQTASMNWMLTNALGGIQLQVPVDDFARAHALLAEIGSADDELVATPDAESASEADSDADGADCEPDDAQQADDEAEPAPNRREQNADRAWRGAIIGILMMPLQLYVFYLLLKVFVSDEELRDQHRQRAWRAAAINLPIVTVVCIWLVAMFRS